jgi:hypothetical protein
MPIIVEVSVHDKLVIHDKMKDLVEERITEVVEVLMPHLGPFFNLREFVLGDGSAVNQVGWTFCRKKGPALSFRLYSNDPVFSRAWEAAGLPSHHGRHEAYFHDHVIIKIKEL